MSRKLYQIRRSPEITVAIRAAARALLDEAGLDAVGLRLIARRIGVSEAAPYRHFSTKEDLLASVAAEGFRELTAALDAVAKGPDPRTQLGLAYSNSRCASAVCFV
jgi:AcrR family transcriptional regulator